MTVNEGKIEKLEVSVEASATNGEIFAESGFVEAIEMFGEEIRFEWLRKSGFVEAESSGRFLYADDLRRVANQLSKIVWEEVEELGQDSDKGLDPLHTDAQWGADNLDDEGFAERSEILLIQCLRLLSNLLDRDDRLVVEFHEKTIR